MRRPGTQINLALVDAPESFSTEELETGLRLMGGADVDLNAFWNDHIAAFRHTVLVAIRETSDALLSPMITTDWRVELESQLEELVRYLALAERYIALRPTRADRSRLN